MRLWSKALSAAASVASKTRQSTLPFQKQKESASARRQSSTWAGDVLAHVEH